LLEVPGEIHRAPLPDLRPDYSKQQAAKQASGWMMPPVSRGDLGRIWIPMLLRALCVKAAQIPRAD